MREYYPGQSVRFTATLSALGVLYTPVNLSLTIQQAKGWGTMSIPLPTIIVDDVGQVHAEVVLPNPLPSGPWDAIMLATGPNESDNGTAQERFLVKTLGT